MNPNARLIIIVLLTIIFVFETRTVLGEGKLDFFFRKPNYLLIFAGNFPLYFTITRSQITPLFRTTTLGKGNTLLCRNRRFA